MTCCRLGRHLQGPKPLVDQLLGFAVTGKTAERTLRIVTKISADSAFLTALQSEWEALYAERPAPIDFRGERLVEYDLLQRTFTDDGDGGGHIPEGVVQSIVDPPPALRRLGVSGTQDTKTWRKLERKQTQELVDKVFSHLDSISPCSPAVVRFFNGDIEKRLRKLAGEDPLASELIPTYTRAYQLAYRTRAYEDALVEVISILRYRRDVGELPDGLGSLMGQRYLKTLPTDPFNALPFVYKKTGTDFVLYSVGPDFHDDGGIPNPRQDDSPGKDIVFWPLSDGPKPQQSKTEPAD